ncbi:copper resistance protein NlpE [Chitinophaga pendula]|uniref:copper resistance protein NlpE N-terminal domain-containing protein n=1 Tax=Chitinophaga TaxID=79328 RepID=UPI000BAFA130|nr:MULTISPECIES: copper resistance protein NlpE N-terminal domain-containing protein [Chitinophaga]ASZ10260.1 hypothetical protein CK934_04325 [Chitinophaga sp. MD30]UCJ06781.1 copper resistance protein NlpE [Chitinophaga pendula]
MKPLSALLFSAITIVCISCGHHSTPASATNTSVKTVPDTSSSGISNDASAVIYTGQLPCGNCSGVAATLTLSASRQDGFYYTLREVYQGLKSGKDEVITSEGTYTILRGTSSDPQAEVVLLNPEKDKVLQRCFQRKGVEVLQLLDNEQRPLPGAQQFQLRRKK